MQFSPVLQSGFAASQCTPSRKVRRQECNVNGEHKTGDGGSARPLLTEAAFRELLGGMSERKFKELRAAGIVGAPLELGPRVARWTQSDYEATLQRLPRRKKAPEPVTLAQGRRARIEAVKAGGV